MDSNPGGPPPLQFDTAVPSIAPIGLITAQGVTCAVCRRAMLDEVLRRQRAIGVRWVPQATRTARPRRRAAGDSFEGRRLRSRSPPFLARSSTTP